LFNKKFVKKEWTHKIIVSEPWDYKNSDGTNNILGKIAKTFNNEAVLFEAEKEIEFEGHYGKYLLLLSRYKNQDLINDKHSTVGGGLLTDFQESETVTDLESRSFYALIGRLEIND